MSNVTVQMNLRVAPGTKKKLEMARFALDKPMSEIVREAVDSYIANASESNEHLKRCINAMSQKSETATEQRQL